MWLTNVCECCDELGGCLRGLLCRTGQGFCTTKLVGVSREDNSSAHYGLIPALMQIFKELG